jgi:hypothetical protein
MAGQAAMTDSGRSAVAARLQAETRFIGDVMGSYVLASRIDESGPRAFACRARSISASGAVVSAPVKGMVGDRLTVNFEDVGLLRGAISRLLPDGFAIAFDSDAADRETLGARINWLKRRALKAVSDRRVHKRVLPRETRAKLIFGGGKRIDCMLIDMSRSGVAVSADLLPKLGTVVAVGSVPGQVIRHFDCGFAVQFYELRELDTLEGLLTLVTDSDRALAKEVLGFDIAQKG